MNILSQSHSCEFVNQDIYKKNDPTWNKDKIGMIYCLKKRNNNHFCKLISYLFLLWFNIFYYKYKINTNIYVLTKFSHINLNLLRNDRRKNHKFWYNLGLD